MSNSIYSIHDKLCEVFGIQSDSPIPNCIFEEDAPEKEIINYGTAPSNAFPIGHIPWNKGMTKDNNEVVKNIGKLVSIARKKYYENWRKHNTKKTYQKRGYEHSAEMARTRAEERNKIKIICPHCNKEGQMANMKRWHFENCNESPKNKNTVL